MLFRKDHVIMSRGEIKCLLGYACKEAHRVNLRAVVVDLGAEQAWACDGCRAAICAVEAVGPNRTPVLVPLSAAAQAAKHVGCRFTLLSGGRVRWEGFDRKAFAALVGADEKVAAAQQATAQGEVAAIDATAAPISVVVPQPADEPIRECYFRTNLLADLALLHGANVKRARVRFGAGEHDPCLVRGTSSPDHGQVEWTVVVMPDRR